jgi:L-alanine-DL-glutamate epimerase-like enolase superfamily enzyme
MYKQVVEKVSVGFDCIKIKIGAIDFVEELSLLKRIRTDFKSHELELRVDANGAFRAQNALENLKRLSEFQIHSIEQPIAQGQWEEMTELCRKSPLPIALDEELMGLSDMQAYQKMFQIIKPQYVILKPSLLGGLKQSEKIIDLAEENGIGWWVTSALEANIGLNAIAQWTATLKNDMYQGLGTGQLFENNVESPLFIKNGALHYGDHQDWNLTHMI